MTRPCFLLLALVFAAASPMDAAAHPEAVVRVRTYNYAHVTSARLAEARETADAIFKRAGISIRWIDCRVPDHTSGAACVEPLDRRGDLMLRLMEIVPQYSVNPPRAVALGTSMLDRGEGSGVLMTVDLFPIRTIAAQARMDEPTLLGRAIAHEIGHLLLGTPEHRGRGLMRAVWSQDELRGVRPARWEFSSGEAVRMRQWLQAGARAAN